MYKTYTITNIYSIQYVIMYKTYIVQNVHCEARLKTENMDNEDVNVLNSFRKKKSYDYNTAVLEEELYLKTKDFTIVDWWNVRNDEYWEEKDKIEGRYYKLQHTLKYVNKYLLNKKQRI